MVPLQDPTFERDIRTIPINGTRNIFSDAAGIYGVFLGKLGGDARVLISFVAPNSGNRLILRIKHSGREQDPPLEVTLGSNNIHLNPSSKSSLTIDDITLCPIEVSGPSESVHLSFEPEVRNNICIQFIRATRAHGHHLNDIELLDENGLEYMPHSASLSVPSN